MNKQSRRDFLKLLGLTAGSLMVPQEVFSNTKTTRKPNVLLIFTDDQGSIDVNCYGAKDLHAPVEVGQSIYQGISTPESQKTLLILPNSRHGAEGNDVPLMQTAIKEFIDQALMLDK